MSLRVSLCLSRMSILSRGTCLSFRSSISTSPFYYGKGLMNKACSSLTERTCSTDEEDHGSGSKQRGCGPVMAVKIASERKKQEDGRYEHTVDLPKTSFGMRANSVVREAEIQKLWDKNEVFKRAVDGNSGGSFILHDGPPYANGSSHIGHALNNVLKDIINCYKFFCQWTKRPEKHSHH